MELTKFGHASVALERDGRKLVIDPGGFTDASALDGAEAVLITHGHLDHFVEDRVRAALADVPGLEVWTNPSVAAELEGAGPRVHTVGHGDAFTAAGFDVKVFGEWHARIHPDIPLIKNVGFLVDDTVFHPGDAFTTPEVPVDTLMVPVHAPWSKLAEVIDWIREVGPARAFGMHDVLLSETGLGLFARMLGEGGPGTGAPYRRVAVDERVDLG
ncbi:MBL fold metallo-hydrolase [Umezawaea sp. Da 62-37]|uniref:MBL fold metallo-hydrolase n=1 Tax=Umezawaea sp. Da 62-37 TaxID=3075927 RepID=UPI0028F73ED2|nr:MBL fold metallo-hydrolase [Umezawaea sp. Da 62-37]WNV88572.1 MBL fold metallo-hydrolase [Umezawaea sp. Da 62-37]